MGLTIQGDKTAALRLRNLSHRAKDVRPVWARFGLYLSRQVARQFASRGTWLGTPWRPLTPEYRLQKRRKGFGSRILVASGELKGSFTGRPMKVERYGVSSAVYGSDLDTAVWHQHGTHHKGKQVNPPRPMLVPNPKMTKFLKRLLKQHLTNTKGFERE